MIRPFQVSDIFLIQRLSTQATKLNATQAVLQPQSALWTALSAVNPFVTADVTTYVLKQTGHRLARAGFLQLRKRPGRPEAEIILLTPALDTPNGHPAIWEKLLSYAIQEAARLNYARLFVDVPDQPLTVTTFAHVGFKVYKRQTIWRLQRENLPHLGSMDGYTIRPVQAQDEWALTQLYRAVTPGDVRRAEGLVEAEGGLSPILAPSAFGSNFHYALAESEGITGSIQLIRGRRGTWLQLWTDTLKPGSARNQALVRFALDRVQSERMPFPIYIGVNDYHGGLSAILNDYGFAPFTDRVHMVKPVLAWARDAVPVRKPALEPVAEVVTTPFSPGVSGEGGPESIASMACGRRPNRLSGAPGDRLKLSERTQRLFEY